MAEYSILFVRIEDHSTENPAATLQHSMEASIREGRQDGIEFLRVDALFDALRTLRERSFDLIVSDLFLPDSQHAPAVRYLKEHAPQTPVVILCHAKDREAAVNAVRKGAHDFFCYEEMDLASFHQAVNGVLKSRDGQSADKRSGADRRTNARFPCRLALSYQTLEHPFLSGITTSETLNISSKGLLFTTEEPLEAGQLLQVSVDWPARLENQVPLKLVAEGRVVRNANGLVAVKIDKYEFRTRKAKMQNSAAGAPTGNQAHAHPKDKARDTAQVAAPPPTAAGLKATRVRDRRSV